MNYKLALAMRFRIPPSTNFPPHWIGSKMLIFGADSLERGVG
jgi:hypothetical protein